LTRDVGREQLGDIYRRTTVFLHLPGAESTKKPALCPKAPVIDVQLTHSAEHSFWLSYSIIPRKAAHAKICAGCKVKNITLLG